MCKFYVTIKSYKGDLNSHHSILHTTDTTKDIPYPTATAKIDHISETILVKLKLIYLI